MPQYRKIKGLNTLEYQHPFDTQALDTLRKVPGLDKAVKLFNEYGIEKIIKTQYTGSNIKITRENYLPTFMLLEYSRQILGISETPDFYLERKGWINGFTVGVKKPTIVLSTFSIDGLKEQEVMFILGHELGHIKSEHTLYYQMASYFSMIGNVLGSFTLGIGEIISKPIELALLYWSRMSEFTADRAGLLACQDIDSTMSVMMKLAGLPRRYYSTINTNSFIQQAKEFEQIDFSNYDKAIKFLMTVNMSHPWTVSRALELIKWYESGQYHAILKRVTQIPESTEFCGTCGKTFRNKNEPPFCGQCGKSLTE